MKYTDTCIICESKNITEHPAKVVPFIAERVWNRKAFKVKLNQCRDCGFSFFNIRLDDFENDKLYSGYRDNNYLKQRNKYEPWYTEKLQKSLFADEHSLALRQQALVQLIQKTYKDLKIKRILDIGGDKGQLLDGIFDGAEKYVYEVSKVDLLPGIKRANVKEKIQYDLVICSNVLEHVAYPSQTVTFIKQFMTKSKTILYIEVPYEKPFSMETLGKRIIQTILLSLLRFKTFISMLGPGMLTHMHEHVNYFSEKSLMILLKKAGFCNIIVSIENINNADYVCSFCTKDN